MPTIPPEWQGPARTSAPARSPYTDRRGPASRQPRPLADASGILFRVTEFKCNASRLPAIQLRFEPVLKRSRKRRPCTLETGEFAGIGTVDAAQFRFDRRKIDAGAAAFADDRTPIHHH